jgi:N-acetylneuraminic acid mutarotase
MGYTYKNAQPWRLQYAFNTSQNGGTGTWTALGSAIPGAVYYGYTAVVTKGRIYLIGGTNSSDTSQTHVQSAPINTDGTLGTWANSGPALPVARAHHCAVVIKDRLWIIGGRSDNTVISAPISDSDGTLGSWRSESNIPPVMSMGGQAFITKNRIFLQVGRGASFLATADVYEAAINDAGEIGTWQASGSLPFALTSAKVAITGSRVFLIGGENGGSALSTIFSAAINSDGTIGSWSTEGTGLPDGRIRHACAVTQSHVFILGGYSTGGAVQSTIYMAPINGDGTLGSWSTNATPLDTIIRGLEVAIVNNYIYRFSGYTSAFYGYPARASFSGGVNDYSTYNYDYVETPGVGVIIPPLESVSGTGRLITPIGNGIINPTVIQVTGSGRTALIGKGQYVPTKEKVSGHGSTGRFHGYGVIVPARMQVNGHGSTTIRGFGSVSAKAPVVSGDGFVTPYILATGRISPKASLVAGTGVTGRSVGAGTVVLPIVVASGSGHVRVNGSGAVTQPAIAVRGRGHSSSSPTDTLRYIRDPVTPATQAQSTPIIPLKFTR